MRDINSTSRGECLDPKQVQLITMHSYDFQTKVVQTKGWLSAIEYCSVAKIYGPAQGIWVWSIVVVRMAIELKYRITP